MYIYIYICIEREISNIISVSIIAYVCCCYHYHYLSPLASESSRTRSSFAAEVHAQRLTCGSLIWVQPEAPKSHEALLAARFIVYVSYVLLMFVLKSSKCTIAVCTSVYTSPARQRTDRPWQRDTSPTKLIGAGSAGQRAQRRQSACLAWFYFLPGISQKILENLGEAHESRRNYWKFEEINRSEENPLRKNENMMLRIHPAKNPESKIWGTSLHLEGNEPCKNRELASVRLLGFQDSWFASWP